MSSPPENGDGLSSPPENGSGISSPPENGSGISSLPENGSGISSLPENGDGISSLPENGDGISSLPETGDGISSLPENGDGISSLPENGDGLSSLPESGDGGTGVDAGARNGVSPELTRILESLLFLSADPVTVTALADAVEAEPSDVLEALERLGEAYASDGRGLVLRRLAGGYALSSHPDAELAARRLLARPRTPPLTSAQAETMAIVAYLQPVSRPEIARIRGVSAESAAATLLERGLIEEAGRSQFGAALYRTTELFLKLFGLGELAELPEIAGFDPSPEFEQQLRDRLLQAGEGRAGATPPPPPRSSRPSQRPPDRHTTAALTRMLGSASPGFTGSALGLGISVRLVVEVDHDHGLRRLEEQAYAVVVVLDQVGLRESTGLQQFPHPSFSIDLLFQCRHVTEHGGDRCHQTRPRRSSCVPIGWVQRPAFGDLGNPISPRVKSAEEVRQRGSEAEIARSASPTRVGPGATDP